jgi:hypothetical protein
VYVIVFLKQRMYTCIRMVHIYRFYPDMLYIHRAEAVDSAARVAGRVVSMSMGLCSSLDSVEKRLMLALRGQLSSVV